MYENGSSGLKTLREHSSEKIEKDTQDFLSQNVSNLL